MVVCGNNYDESVSVQNRVNNAHLDSEEIELTQCVCWCLSEWAVKVAHRRALAKA